MGTKKILDELAKISRGPGVSPDLTKSFKALPIDSLQRLTPEEYAYELCEALNAYNYPYVTCFDFDAFLRNDGYSKFKSKHQNMKDVEGLIRNQLFSKNLKVLKNGISNVLFWGYASQKGRQRDRVAKFRGKVANEQLKKFRDALQRQDHLKLDDLRTMKIPEFGGVSFATKLIMFLSPNTYPVLDAKIAKFARQYDFVQLSGLTLNANENAIPLYKKNVKPYETWAAWCSDISNMVNDLSSSPCNGLRAVDVERAIYCRLNEGKNREARLLLMGPIT